MRYLGIVGWCLALACSAPAMCPADPATSMDSDVVFDAGNDAEAPADAAVIIDGCNPLTPVRIELEGTYAALSPNQTPRCRVGGRIRLFRHDDRSLVWDSDVLGMGEVCEHETIDGLAPGDYDFTMESESTPQWLLGGDILRPERCAVGEVGGPFCEPMRLILHPCDSRTIMVVLYCDPDAGDCPAVPWPWLGPPP